MVALDEELDGNSGEERGLGSENDEGTCCDDDIDDEEGGDGDSDGIMNRLDDYLSDQLNATTGFMVTKNTTLENQMSRLEDSISSMETRLEKRQEVLEAQFSAMETLMSSLNSQGDYLTSFFESYNGSS